MKKDLSDRSDGIDGVLQAGFAGPSVPDLDRLVSAASGQPALDLRVPVAGEDVVGVRGPPLLAPVRPTHVPKLNFAVFRHRSKLEKNGFTLSMDGYFFSAEPVRSFLFETVPLYVPNCSFPRRPFR